jgi:hypothetical protein
MEVIGLEKFTETLDRRADVNGRERGLITGRRILNLLQAEVTC